MKEDEDLQSALTLMTSTAKGNSAALLSYGIVRPDNGGDLGRKLNADVNVYKLYTSCSRVYPAIYQYDVAISKVEETNEESLSTAATTAGHTAIPDHLKQKILLEALMAAKNRGEAGITTRHIDGIAYDGSKFAFTPTEFEFGEHSFFVDIRTSDRKLLKRYFEIHMKYVGRLDPEIAVKYCRGDQELVQGSSSEGVDGLSSIMQAFDVAMQAKPLSDTKYKKRGHGRFFDLEKGHLIADGAEILTGLFQSVRPTQLGLCLNLDRVASAFVAPGPMIQGLSQIVGGSKANRLPSQLAPYQLHLARRQLAGIEVEVTHPVKRKIHKVVSLSTSSARDATFTLPNGQETTVHHYFMDKYNIHLKYPDLPCAVLANGSMIPVELCRIRRGTIIHPRNMTPAMVQGLIQLSAVNPQSRKQQIERLRKENAYEECRILRNFGIRVDPTLVQVEARVLPAPRVIYKDHYTITPEKGSWNLASAKFLIPGDTLRGLILINASRRSQSDCSHFMHAQMEACQRVRMNIDMSRSWQYMKCDADPTKAKQVLMEAGRALKATSGEFPQLFFVFMEPNDDTFYEAIKKVAALELPSPVQTQCVNVYKAMSSKSNRQYCANVAMKMNIKLGGTNHTVDIPEMPKECMLIGLDVTHPNAHSGLPSIVASVATLKSNVIGLNSEIGLQFNDNDKKQAQEVILESQVIFTNHLKAWQEVNQGRLPSTIIVFRDGVSEGEYEKVLNLEVDQLRSAAAKINDGYKPKITFIICAKRHHMVFFPHDGSSSSFSNSRNLPAGTVIDRGIVPPIIFDFYLQPHAAIKGTAQSTHYIVLRDDNKFSSNDLQKICNDLCSAFGRATKSISLPPVIMHAHELADKVQKFFYGDEGCHRETMSQYEGATGGDLCSRQKGKANLDDIVMKLNRPAPSKDLTPLKRTAWYL